MHMNGLQSLSVRKLFLGALVLLLGTAVGGQAGVIVTPNSISAPPATTLPALHGTPVVEGGGVTEQYSGVGVLFAFTAITEIDGVKVWTPTTDLMSSAGSSLHYGAGSRIWAGFNVPGNPDTWVGVGTVAVEFIGLAEGEGGLIGFDQHLVPQIMTGNNNTNLVGPHGGILAILPTGGDIFALGIDGPGQDELPTAWGIASIEIGEIATMNDPPVNEVPEPGTLLLAGFGAAGLFGYRWRRNRS
jgi:hypothetical protein